jgi:Tfp pilus assembly protein PilV
MSVSVRMRMGLERPGNSVARVPIHSHTHTRTRTHSGFVLFEIMLALMIFCLVAVGLTAALHQTVDTSIMIRDESQVRQELENLLAETASTKVKPGKSEIQSSDGRIRYEREIRAVQAKTARGEQLSNLYEIDVQASWRSSGQDRSAHANMTIYQP